MVKILRKSYSLSTLLECFQHEELPDVVVTRMWQMIKKKTKNFQCHFSARNMKIVFNALSDLISINVKYIGLTGEYLFHPGKMLAEVRTVIKSVETQMIKTKVLKQ